MLFRRIRADSADRRPTLIEELERLARRARALPLAAPFLLLGGLGLGKVTAGVLALPEDTPVRIVTGEEVPRIRLEALSRRMRSIRENGDKTFDYVVLYQDHVAPVERVLRRRGLPARTARQVAWPLVEHTYRRGLSPATVVSILLVESRGKPSATSPVGARGLMQVMPEHAGRWRGCRGSLYDIEANICYGTAILANNLRVLGDERRALLAYNGCVRGKNTPNCWHYPEMVWRLRAQIERELASARRAPGAAAAP
ncbi:MAG: transglycosylase SLT domain-containing protein [Gemmatimonadetes bacterium]|nr:transglycosylase SLT domain-containing protein [Gemmatimonadota bacterium]